jgi:hypothetical protein
MVIEGNRVRYDGRSWQVLEVDGTAVHLVDGDEGVCVECLDDELRTEIAALPRAA